MKNVILRTLLALTIMLSLFACSDLKKEVTIRTIGGEKKTLKIKVPNEFKENKEAYFAMHPLFYMQAWNEGVDESDNPNSKYKFDFNKYAKSSMVTLQSNAYIIEEIGEYLDDKKDLQEKIKAEGRAFANKQQE